MTEAAKLKIPMLKFKGEQLSEKNTEIMMKLILSGQTEKPLEECEKLTNDFLGKVTVKHISGRKLPFIISDKFYIMSMLTWCDTPGAIVTLLWLAFNYHKKTAKKFLTLSDWAEMFPWGTPSKKELSDWWESQKGYSMGEKFDNAVDALNWEESVSGN